MVRFADSTKGGPKANPSWHSTAVEQSLASGKSTGKGTVRSQVSKTSRKSSDKSKVFKPDNNLGIPSKAKAQFAAQTSVRKASSKLRDNKRLAKVSPEPISSLALHLSTCL